MEETTELEPIIEDDPLKEPPTLLQIFSNLPDEASTIKVLNTILIESLLVEISQVSTLKKLSKIPNLSNKFTECFETLQELVCSIDDRTKFDQILKNVNSNFECDILLELLKAQNDCNK